MNGTKNILYKILYVQDRLTVFPTENNSFSSVLQHSSGTFNAVICVYVSLCVHPWDNLKSNFSKQVQITVDCFACLNIIV